MTNTIEAEGLTKSFGQTRALRGVDLAAGPGTILALLGPNGAGEAAGFSLRRIRRDGEPSGALPGSAGNKRGGINARAAEFTRYG
jgi:ABC-type hemin transport system ATPase subunit